MNFAFDLQERQFRRSLAETIAWCADQHLTAVGEESDEIKRRRGMVEEAVRLMHEAQVENGGLGDRLRDHDKWRRGDRLLQKADIDTIAPLSQSNCAQPIFGQVSPLPLVYPNRKEKGWLPRLSKDDQACFVAVCASGNPSQGRMQAEAGC